MAAIRAAMSGAGVEDKQLTPEQLGDLLRKHKGPKGHGWSGKRRKLKKSHQDHQRPRRRRA